MSEPQVHTSNISHNPTVNINNMNMNFGHRQDPLQAMFQNMGRNQFFMFQDEEEEPQSQGVSDDFINKLPEMEEGKEADCNICLEKVGSNGNKSCVLPCGHAFDKSCLSMWLKDHDSCPCCRTKLD